MKAQTKWLLIGTFVILTLPVAFLFLYYPVHDFRAKHFNTRYGEGYSEEAFDRVAVGMQKSAILETLGKPLEVETFAEHYQFGPNSQKLAYSAPINHADYELVHLILNSEGTIVDKSRHVTD